MPSNYKANDPYVNEQVDLDDIFITDAWLVDQFVGGTLFGWGSGAWGNMGIGAAGAQGFVYYSSPVQVGSLTNWKQVSCSVNTTGAIKTDGTLWMWGQGDYGALGNGNTTVRYSSPIQVGSLTNWKQLSCAAYTTAAVKTDGTLWTWGGGTGNNGQLGNGAAIGFWYSSPIQVGLLNNWKQVSMNQHTAAVKNDATMWTWGYNVYGQLGNGNTINYSSPIQVGSLTNWKQVVASSYNTAAVKTDGTLWAWGLNVYGQLGLGESDVVADFSTANLSSPMQASGGTTWANTDPYTQILTLSHRALHSALIKQDGTLWVGGVNNAGQLGNGTTITYSSPIQIGNLTNWKQVAISGQSSYNIGITAAIKTDGTLWTWGSDSYGGLGNGTTLYYSSPIQVGALTTWKQVSCGYRENVYAVKTDGTLWAWGNGTSGELGNGTALKYSSPVQVGSLTNWNSVSGGYLMFAAIKTNGTLWTCGSNSYGYLGNGTIIDYSSPIQVGALTNWKQVSCGTGSVLAVKTDGTLWSWGLNNQYILGNGNSINYSSPIQIGSLTNWKYISAGAGFAAAIKTDGTLWAWGNQNLVGQLGNGTTIGYSSPVQIGSLTNWNQVFVTQSSSVAYTNDNKVYFWGQTLGAGPTSYTASISSPVQVGALTNWKQIVVSTAQTAAIKTDGTLWTWGYNTYGGLGNGTTIHYSSPIQVGSLTNWKQVACGYYDVSAIKTDGTLWAWGRNDTSTGGMLGNGTTISYSSPIQVGLLTNWKQVDGSKTTFAITFKDIT